MYLADPLLHPLGVILIYQVSSLISDGATPGTNTRRYKPDHPANRTKRKIV